MHDFHADSPGLLVALAIYGVVSITCAIIWAGWIIVQDKKER